MVALTKFENILYDVSSISTIVDVRYFHESLEVGKKINIFPLFSQ